MPICYAIRRLFSTATLLLMLFCFRFHAIYVEAGHCCRCFRHYMYAAAFYADYFATLISRFQAR